jgi:hypothetical protein
MFSFFSLSVYAQHTVNDVQKYGGWYRISVEIYQSGNVGYLITQCYPSGETYEVIGHEREKLPIYLKVLCMGMVEAGMKDRFDFNTMTFEENGYCIQMTAISLTFIFKFSKPEAEILKELGGELINTYKYRKWE